jgi:hypothetical protein
LVTGIDEITLLEQRRVEAQIIKPIFKAFSGQFGFEATRELLGNVIGKLAEEKGKDLAQKSGGNSIKHFAEVLKTMASDGSIELEGLELNDDRFSFNVTKCKFVDIYRELGIPELGLILSCNRDYAFCSGFNPNIKLTRTQTIMEGAEGCDFRYRLVSDE